MCDEVDHSILPLHMDLDVFDFFTTSPKEVGVVHEKAMPAILTPKKNGMFGCERLGAKRSRYSGRCLMARLRLWLRSL